jgi:hypothetical protein
MPRLIVIVLLTLSLLLTLFAQNDSISNKNSLVEGAWAMQFQMSSYFTLSSFQGTIISVKKHLTDQSAIRFGVSTTLNISDDNAHRELITFSNYVNYNSYDNHLYRLSINSQYLYYLLGSTDVHLYVGSGPEIYYSWDKSEYEGDTARYASRDISSGFGMSGVIGVEWFATSSLSLHAEYSTIARYTWTDNKREFTNFNITKVPEIKWSSGNYFSLSPSYIKLGLSAYF